MARVKALVNNTPVKLLESHVTREGERAIDQSKIVLTPCSSICIGDTVQIIQDAVNLNCMVGAYFFQGSVKDESGLCNNAYGSIAYPRLCVNVLWCNTSGGVSNNGTRDSVVIVNGSPTCVSPGKVNSKGIVFDGTCDYVSLSCESLFDIDQTTQLSASMWIKTSDVSVPLISKKATGTTDQGWEIGLNSCGQIEYRMTNTATTNELHIRGDTAVNTCVWTHIAVTYSGVPGCGADAVDVYVNGRLDTKGVITTNLTSCTLNCESVTYGAYADGSSKYAGSFDDGNIWLSKKLTDEEIRSVFLRGIIEESTGKFGCAMVFNGTDSYQEIPHTTDFDFTGRFDIQVWAKWSTTSLGYIYARRLLSGNGFALSVNRLATGDIVAEIDGNNIKTCGTSYNDDAWHFIRVYRDSNNVVHLEVDNIEKNTFTVGSDLTLASPALFIGTNHNRTAYFDGMINVIRMYKTSLGSVETTRLYSEVTSTSIMKFGGFSTKITKEINKKNIVAHSFGKSLGETEVRAQQYNSRSPEFIIDDLVRNNTSLVPHIHGTCSGIIISRFNADGKLIDIIRDLSQLMGKTFYTDALKQFHLHETAFSTTCFVFTHGVCSTNFECVNDDTEIVNDLVVIGESKRYGTSETFTGDGCGKTVYLQHGAVSSSVTVGGTAQTAEQDYETCVINKTITFDVAPGCGVSVVVDYDYEIPLLIRGEKQSSIDLYGRHSKRLVMPWIKTRNDGIRFINGYLNRFKEIRASFKLDLAVMKNSLNEGDIVRVINSIKNVDSSFVVKSLTWRYPDMKTTVLLGEFKFDDLEYEKQIIEKLHDLESAITEIKDIRCSEQLEEVMALCDSVNIIGGIECGSIFAESMTMTDGVTVTSVVPATYNVNFYNDGSIYGTCTSLEGYTFTGFTSDGFTVLITDFYLLLENGDKLLMEDGSLLILDGY